MTRQELIEQVKRQSKRTNRGGTIWLAGLIAVVMLLAGFGDEAPPAVEAILGAAFLGVILAAGPALILSTRRSMRRSGLACPHCHALLTNVLAPVAIASARCGKCGEKIVDDEV
jgi:hypothetical protein